MSSQLTLGEWAPPLDPEQSQYHTPLALARRMVEWADVCYGMRILEPSAGGGNIVRALNESGAHVTAVERDPAWCRVLRDDESLHCRVIEGDFLTRYDLGEFDMAVMNPPLNDGVAADHVARALDHSHRVVTILRAQDLHGVDRYETLWKRCHVWGIAHLVRRPIYSGKGGATEFVVVDIGRAKAWMPIRLEWWVL